VQTYTTTCITWVDGDTGPTEAASASDAAIKHAVDGWENEEIDNTPADVEDVPIGDREPVEIQVTDEHGIVTRWLVSWDREAGEARATEIDLPL